MDGTNPMQLLLQEKDAVIADLRLEVAHLKTAERMLWLAVANLQAATGEANGWSRTGTLPDGEEGGYDDFNECRENATKQLGGVVSLKPAG